MYAYRRVYNHSSHQLFELHVACNKSHLATQISHLALRVLQCKDSPWHHGTVSILLLFEMFCFIQSRKAPLVGFLRYLKCPCKVTRCLKSSAGFLDPASSIPASLYVSCTSGLFLPYHVLTLVVKSRWIASMTKFRHTSLSLSLSVATYYMCVLVYIYIYTCIQQLYTFVDWCIWFKTNACWSCSNIIDVTCSSKSSSLIPAIPPCLSTFSWRNRMADSLKVTVSQAWVIFFFQVTWDVVLSANCR